MISTKKVPNSKSGCHISTKKRQCNDQKKKDKRTNNGRQNTRQKKKVWTTWTPLLKGVNSVAPEGLKVPAPSTERVTTNVVFHGILYVKYCVLCFHIKNIWGSCICVFIQMFINASMAIFKGRSFHGPKKWKLNEAVVRGQYVFLKSMKSHTEWYKLFYLCYCMISKWRWIGVNMNLFDTKDCQ